MSQYQIMKTVIKYIKEGQKMLEIIPLMQTNTIYNKGIPGIGATTSEMNARRNSIIVLPFVPVIEGKILNKEGRLRIDLIGVYDNVNIEKITTYIESRGTQTKKILCTPEKFNMVIQAIKNQGEDPYETYFLLLDECESMIKDVDYRPKIKLPMKDFFLFKGKAMVSATPITPRDSRFERHGFTYVKIRPHKQWKSYRKPLDLIGTNNVASVLRNFIKDNPEETICIFTNCSKTITKTISDLKLESEAMVFSSHRLYIKRFKVTGVKHSYTSIKGCKGELAKVNFFTGRFFSAVDMIFPDIKPVIVMVTNIYHSTHSKIDPMTDAIQISGRFREGIKKMVHISNYNPDIPLKAPKEMKAEIDELLSLYRLLENYKKASPTNPFKAQLVGQMLEEAPFIKFMTDGKLDTYLADNIQHQQFVSSYYSNHLKLIAAYERTNYFIVNEDFVRLKITDEDIMRKDAVAGAKRREEVAIMLDEFVTKNGPFNLDLSFYEERNEFYLMDEVVYSAYFDLGMAFMINAKFKLKALRLGLLNRHKEKVKVSEVITEAVDISFHTNQTLTNNECKEQLQGIYDTYSNTPMVATGTDIKLYFETTETHSIIRDGNQLRGYRLGEFKYPRSNKLTSPNAHLNTF